MIRLRIGQSSIDVENPKESPGKELLEKFVELAERRVIVEEQKANALQDIFELVREPLQEKLGELLRRMNVRVNSEDHDGESTH